MKISYKISKKVLVAQGVLGLVLVVTPVVCFLYSLYIKAGA
jgi:hypothetical protein